MTFRGVGPTGTARSSATAASAAVAPATRRPTLPPLPRVWPIKSIDIGWVPGVNGVVIAAMWVRHGALDELSTPGGTLTAVGQLAGLFAAYLALVQLVLTYATTAFTIGAGGPAWVECHPGYGAIVITADERLAWSPTTAPLLSRASHEEALS